jgi:hypothetical protein
LPSFTNALKVNKGLSRLRGNGDNGPLHGQKYVIDTSPLRAGLANDAASGLTDMDPSQVPQIWIPQHEF